MAGTKHECSTIRFVVRFDLPGVEPDRIELTIEKNVLTVSAERRGDRQDGDAVVAAERLQGSFSRQLFLGETLDPDHVEARYEQGVLTLTIPVAEAAKPPQGDDRGRSERRHRPRQHGDGHRGRRLLTRPHVT